MKKNRKCLFGTSLYLGIGESMENMAKHLRDAQDAGMNILFTSLQLPEADREEVIENIKDLAQMANSCSLTMVADVSEGMTKRFGIDKMDTAGLRGMGFETIRLDYGYTIEETARLTRNSEGLKIELNASVPPETLRKTIQELDRRKANMENLRACHNYYPMQYTGMPDAMFQACNSVCSDWNIPVGCFIASGTHRRMPCFDGLVSVESHRNIPLRQAIRSAYFLGADDIIFGDDFASHKELCELGTADRSLICLRWVPYSQTAISAWCSGQTFTCIQCLTGAFVRSRQKYSGSAELVRRETVPEQRRHGDVLICSRDFGRYAGELQIMCRDLPPDPRLLPLGKIIDEDIPLLDMIIPDSDTSFCLVNNSLES